MWVGEFAEEALYVIFQDRGTLLDDILHVLQDHVLHLGRGEGHHRHNRRSYFLGQVLDQVGTVHEVHVADHQLDAPEDHTGVDVGQSRQHPVYHHFRLLLCLGVVSAQEVQDEDLGPFHALVDGHEQSPQQHGVYFDVFTPSE